VSAFAAWKILVGVLRAGTHDNEAHEENSKDAPYQHSDEKIEQMTHDAFLRKLCSFIVIPMGERI